MELAVEGLLLQQPFARIRADRDAHVAEDRRRGLTTGVGRTLVHALARPGGLLRRHPVEEYAVGLRAREGAHLRPHCGHHEACPARQGRAHRGQALAHHPERALGEAGSDPEPQPGWVEPEVRHLRRDVRRARGGRAPARPRRRRAPAPRPQTRRRSPGRSPSGGRSTTASHSRGSRSAHPAHLPRRDRVPRPRRSRAASAQPSSRSSNATHSMWGVWGNMSTGRTLTSRKPASTIWRALGASVVGLQET